MIELPEALTLSRQLSDTVTGKVISRVLPPTKPHKFCWWNGDPADYEKQLVGSHVKSAEGFGIYAQLTFSNGKLLCVNDGVNVRLIDDTLPKDYQLAVCFNDCTSLVFTVAMYGGIVVHDDYYDNEYYLKNRAYTSPFSSEFECIFNERFNGCKPTLSAKAFLATEQRFPGIGNGVVQDILFAAKINPKRKLQTLDSGDRERLLSCTVSVLREMVDMGGRDTEKDIFGNPGGYRTKMSKNTIASGCPACGGEIVKEAYLGGSVYYCPVCQKLI